VELLVIPAISPPLPHRAVVKRDRAVGRSPSGNRLPADLQVHIPSLPCAYWEPSELPLGNGPVGLRLGPNVDVVAAGPRMLIDGAADVGVGDVIVDVTNGGQLVAAGPLRVVVNHWRRTHHELGLEDARELVPAEGS
jgi:hypothetical protein